MIKYLLIFFTSITLSQTHKASYSISIIENGATTNNLKLQELLKNSKNVSYELIFNNSKSVYKKEESITDDILMNRKINLTEVFAGKNKKFYSSFNKEYYYTDDNSDDSVIISYSSPKWILLNEQKKIGDYTCYKAINAVDSKYKKKGEIIVWYSPQISTNFGPNKYQGLPGLVIELKNSVVTYKLSKLELNSKETIDAFKKKGKIMISEEQYYKEYKKLLLNK